MSAKARILVVDDERSMQEFLEIFFRSEGYEAVTAGDVDTALLHLESDEFDVVITDIKMPKRSGIDLLRAAQTAAPDTVLIVMTAFASTETAIMAMKEGAYDYITKPFKVDEIRIVVEKALEKKALSSENRRLRSELRSRSRDKSIIGNSAAMRRVFDFVSQVADSRANVLVSGESGTGKEMVARAIHAGGERRERPFVAVNCGAIPENLLESELFGHVKGAFTGAVQNKTGLFEVAEGGTVFLDEIGELTLPLQVKLLRVIQERSFRRVGGTSDIRFDARIVAATNRKLEDEVAHGRFREDLYYRLNVIEIPMPPLRERRDDIPLLIRHFIDKYAGDLGKPVRDVSAAVLGKLMEYEFPGNVRELENVIERAVALGREEIIDLDVLPPTVLNARENGGAARIPEGGVDLDALMRDFEKNLLLEALRLTGGVKKRAAQRLGISFRSFRYRLEKLGLEQIEDGEA
ncbi:MAG: sigma-54 dependent transcriptional regulator [Myxococcales bacterium]|nr:sigma-54 dependent transcriptional regulator [Myxococcales bacterium]MDH5305811.1 sigma-54 dependent transcriptional regulator [Myxococcales bacterium]MDH5566810.1 sigma-54 dependent transcriptional regulator [Myxococcales bacterium]